MGFFSIIQSNSYSFLSEIEKPVLFGERHNILTRGLLHHTLAVASLHGPVTAAGFRWKSKQLTRNVFAGFTHFARNGFPFGFQLFNAFLVRDVSTWKTKSCPHKKKKLETISCTSLSETTSDAHDECYLALR